MAGVQDLLSKMNEATAKGIIQMNTVIFYHRDIGWQIHNLQADEPDPRVGWASNGCRCSENETGKHQISQLGPFGE